MDPGPTISRPYTRYKWVGRMIWSQAIVSARAQDLLRQPESMTIIMYRTDNVRLSFPLLYERLKSRKGSAKAIVPTAKEILVTIWYMLTRRELHRHMSKDRYEQKLSRIKKIK